MLTVPAYLLFASLAASAALMSLAGAVYVRTRATSVAAAGQVLVTPSSLVPYVLAQRRYKVATVGTAAAYGTLYSLLTSIVAYRPDLNFSALPGLAIPSVQPVQLVGAPLYVPELTVFLTDHVAMVLIPITLILMLAVSSLVGVNVALSLFAYDNRTPTAGRAWGAQLGAVVGLFTGCPTCAGLYFFSLLGGTGAVSFAETLGHYQPVFLLLSVPALLVSPWLVSRSLARVYRDGCIVPR